MTTFVSGMYVNGGAEKCWQVDIFSYSFGVSDLVLPADSSCKSTMKGQRQYEGKREIDKGYQSMRDLLRYPTLLHALSALCAFFRR